MRWSNITEKLHFTFAIAQGYACETKPVAFALATAVRLAATLSELFTTFCSGRVGCPNDFPFSANLLPPPVSWIVCGRMLEDRDTGATERGSSSGCRKVVVNVVHDCSGEKKTLSQNRWTDHTLLHIFANCGISKLG